MARPGCATLCAACRRYIATPNAKHRLFVWLTPNPRRPPLVVFAATTTSRSASSTRARTSYGRAARERNSARSSPASATRPRPASRPSRSRTPHPNSARVGEAARRLVELRDGWLNPPGLDPADLAKRTLTNLYNQRPTWLANAHADLDAAVFAAYGWPADLGDTEVLERLLVLNSQRASSP